jgi:DNA-binding transcriptional ArsR family regulator
MSFILSGMPPRSAPTPESRRQITDVRTLRALANPIRHRLLGHLMALGAQTASECAAAVGASPSNCSYHLRQLERFGLVERAPDADGGDGRDRPWRPVATGLRYGRDGDEGADPLEARLTRRLIHAGIDHDAELAHRAVDAHDALPAAWREAETLASFGLLVNAAELTAIRTALDAILRPWIGLTRGDAPSDARPVHVQLAAFVRPGAEAAPAAEEAGARAMEPAAADESAP